MDILQLSDLFPFYELRDSTVSKSAVFEVSRYYTETKSSEGNKGEYWRPWDKITSNTDKGNIYQGKIPSLGKSYYSDSNQHEKIISFVNQQEENKHPLGLVVSCVDYWELSGYSVVLPINWTKNNVKHILLPVSDFSTNISNECIIAVIKEMNDCVDSGKSVYVHCKAGRSRSAMVSAVYLGGRGDGEHLHPSDNIEEIEKYLVSKRPQVSMNNKQREKAVDVIRTIKKIQLEQSVRGIADDLSPQEQHAEELFLNEVDIPPTPSSNLKESLKEFLSSLELKNAIIHFTSFKMMAVYACKNQNVLHTSHVTSDIQDFFNEIYAATDEKWYLYLTNTAGSLQKLIDGSAPSYAPYGLSIWKTAVTEKYQNECEQLRSGFTNELDNYLAHIFNCTVGDIKSAALELSTAVKGIVPVEVEKKEKVDQQVGNQDINLSGSFVMVNK